MGAGRWLVRGGVAVIVGYALLAIPEGRPEVPERPEGEAFLWDRDALWQGLERLYFGSRDQGCPDDVDARLEATTSQLAALAGADPEEPGWDRIESQLFELAAVLGGCARVDDVLALRRRFRIAAKDASVSWAPGRVGRDRLYRLLYGSRAAVEELLLQFEPSEMPALSPGREVPSSAPSVEIHGVRIHSGDLLLSRGGAPTSAFIARGNDYPGNFSHVALVHVDGGVASAIEAHIERGVTIADVDTYMADKKLRILVLRVRPDHPALIADPLLPHHAATEALEQARARHIPYDFAMDIDEHEKQFCSEVASAAYDGRGVVLWEQLSTFSTPGLARWMTALGVRHLETHAPSDLEYDPQLQVVAEWHDPETLIEDHVDNAVIDAMIARAEAGAELEHAAALLPVARLLKAYSVALNLTGREGPVPEGMSATVALRAQWLTERHAAIKAAVRDQVAAFHTERGHLPPYWELVRMADAAGTSAAE